jgi:hypothetical protein
VIRIAQANGRSGLVSAIIALTFAVGSVISWVNPDLIAPSGMTWGVWLTLAPVGAGAALSYATDAALLRNESSGRRSAKVALGIKLGIIAAIAVVCILDMARYLSVPGSIGEAVGRWFGVLLLLWLALIVVSFVATVQLLRSAIDEGKDGRGDA